MYTPPQALFIASPVSGDPPLSVAFTDQSSGDILLWSWDFGDGGTSAEQHPVHVCSKADTCSVKLVVTGSAGSIRCHSTAHI